MRSLLYKKVYYLINFKRVDVIKKEQEIGLAFENVHSINRPNYRLIWGGNIIMKKKIAVIVSMIFVLIIVVLVFSNRKSNRIKSTSGNMFANPRQLGEFALYGSDENKFIYYRPLKDIKNTEQISRQLFEKINFEPLKDKETFDYDRKEIFLVENIGKATDKSFQHVQIQYHKEGEQFVIFSAYEVNNFEDDFRVLSEQYEEQGLDLFGNEVNMIKLKEDRNCIYIKDTSPASLSYMYYKYDDEKDKITLVHSAGNEVLAFQDDILYHVAFNIRIKDEELIELLNTFIK